MEGSFYTGVLALCTGSIIYIGRFIKEAFVGRFLTTMNINSNEEPFQWVTKYLGEHSDFFYTAPTLTITEKLLKKNVGWNDDDRNKEENTAVQLVPGTGLHIFEHNGKMFWLERVSNSELSVSGWDKKPFLWESLILSTFSASSDAFRDFLEKSREFSKEEDRGLSKIYILGSWKWITAISKPARSFDSVILDGDLSTKIYNDASNFFANKEWYYNSGVPYRRGYLLYGPPGCGKTSFISALAGKLKLNICLLNLSSGSLDDDDLNQKLHEAPKDSIILLEDIDSIFVERNSVVQGMKKVSFSGLLNALDGIASQEGRITVMTTNHIEKLDPALLRPGRCDVKLEFKKATHDQIKNLFMRFYPEKSQLSSKFLEKLPEKSVTMAELQAHFLLNKDEPEKSIETAENLLKRREGENDNVDLKNWMKRLGLAKYYKNIKKEKFRSFGEIKTGGIDSLVDTFGESQRIQKMLEGDTKTLKNFQIAPPESIRKMFNDYFDVSEKQINHLLEEELKGKEFSYFELTNFLRSYPNFLHAKENINELVDPFNFEPKKESLKSFLKRLKYDELYLKNFEKNGIDDVSMLDGFSDSDLKTLGDVKLHGHRLKILRAIKILTNKN
eukprot:gene11604-4847_t